MILDARDQAGSGHGGKRFDEVVLVPIKHGLYTKFYVVLKGAEVRFFLLFVWGPLVGLIL